MIIYLYVISPYLVVVDLKYLISPRYRVIIYVEVIFPVVDSPRISVSSNIDERYVFALFYLCNTVNMHMPTVHKYYVVALVNNALALVGDIIAVYVVSADKYVLSFVFHQIGAKKFIVYRILGRATTRVGL